MKSIGRWTPHKREKIKLLQPDDKITLCDAQTSGGLLIAVENGSVATVESVLLQNGIKPIAIGEIIAKEGKVVRVI